MGFETGKQSLDVSADGDSEAVDVAWVAYEHELFIEPVVSILEWVYLYSGTAVGMMIRVFYMACLIDRVWSCRKKDKEA